MEIILSGAKICAIYGTSAIPVARKSFTGYINVLNVVNIILRRYKYIHRMWVTVRRTLI